MDAISVENLSKTYSNGVKAVDGVSFHVKQGEIFGLLGPNGAAAISALVNRLERAGITVHEVTMSRPTLDDVYLHHTGQHFTASGDEQDAERAGIR